jgi:NAD(P)-dependent dehydrogenase (short-subunit alcohol dehydrogenase family)
VANVSKVWFVTGASRGLGREFARAALGRGDQVAAAARRLESLDDLTATYGSAILPLRVDVTDRKQVEAAVAATTERFGHLDVVVNNAGYGLFGAFEEISEQQLRDQLETNLFGVFHVTRAVLPVLRQQQSGHIIQISTISGIAAFPLLSAYNASKWALEGMTESLAQEVAGFGIKVTLVEPGGFATDWGGSSAVWADPHPAYEDFRQAILGGLSDTVANFSDPKGVGPAMLKIADAEEPPLRVFFGEEPTVFVKDLYAQRLSTWKQWEQVALLADGKSR